MYITRLLAGMILGCAASIAIYCAHNAVAHRELPQLSFPRLFPKPTGHNGYEEFVLAADLAQSCPVWQAYENVYYDQPGPTLELKRRTLADPTVRRVLTTLRAGLRKRILSPRETPELYTLAPELGVFRSLARLLGVEMDVLFADGKTSRAIDCLNDGLNFGRSVEVGTLLSGVVGLYIENLTLHRCSDHLDQLTPLDCHRLIQVAHNHLRQPDLQIALISAERSMYLRSLRKYRMDAGALLDKLDPGPNASGSEHQDYASVCRLVRANPDSGAAIFDQAAALVGAHYDQTLAEIKLPAWQRKYPKPLDRDSPAAKLIYSICPPSYARLGDRFASEQALVQILAVHAGVLRYQRQRNRLPDSLEELKLGELTIDPFTGTSLGYQRLGGTAYEISSIGAYDPGDTKHAPTGQRIPITVIYPPKHKP